ncbi:bleomycin resistance protein [Cellulophaga baltica]|uniref:bleomycin resistance protein n=1 Tax=Cellulophaga baltica TaxID=76594 RepID=UPI0003F6D2F7|nr:VOC family protein [Cellulophaga baltica]AIY12776.1 Bleomycin resistance protein [Cellulophaga baltica NN016038]
MLHAIHPKLPMRNKTVTKQYYIDQLGFNELGTVAYDDYLMISKDDIEIHFFKFETLKPKENYGQVYIRTTNITELYQTFLNKKISIHPNGSLNLKPWGLKEFSILDPDHNLITFGEQLLKNSL